MVGCRGHGRLQRSRLVAEVMVGCRGHGWLQRSWLVTERSCLVALRPVVTTKHKGSDVFITNQMKSNAVKIFSKVLFTVCFHHNTIISRQPPVPSGTLWSVNRPTQSLMCSALSQPKGAVLCQVCFKTPQVKSLQTVLLQPGALCIFKGSRQSNTPFFRIRRKQNGRLCRVPFTLPE